MHRVTVTSNIGTSDKSSILNDMTNSKIKSFDNFCCEKLIYALNDYLREKNFPNLIKIVEFSTVF